MSTDARLIDRLARLLAAYRERAYIDALEGFVDDGTDASISRVLSIAIRGRVLESVEQRANEYTVVGDLALPLMEPRR